MRASILSVLFLVLLVGCSAPGTSPGAGTPTQTSIAQPSPTPEPTSTPTPTTNTPASTTTTTAPTATTTSTPQHTTELELTGPLVSGIGANISAVRVEENWVQATILFANYGQAPAEHSFAVRFVENDSFAKIGRINLTPGQKRTIPVALPTYDDDPANLTVQVRINGTIVDERAATKGTR